MTETMRILDRRPADVPAHFEVWNAPRPLFGHVEWQGAFRHGVFYVAVDPNDRAVAERFTERNVALDGMRVLYAGEWGEGWMLCPNCDRAVRLRLDLEVEYRGRCPECGDNCVEV